MPTKKVLIISYYWPPSGGAGVQRWLKFAKYLPEFGVEPIVLTVDPDKASYGQLDSKLNDEVNSDLLVFKTKSFEPLQVVSKLFGKKNVPYGGFSNVNKTSLTQTILRFIRGNFFVPDARVGWNRHAIKHAKEIINQYQIETIITTSPPHSTQLIGLKLKKQLNINWIADLRDPWTDIYYYKDLLHTGLVKQIDKNLEKKVLKKADQVITVGDYLKKQLFSKCNEANIAVIHNGYDHSDFENLQCEKSKEFTITYTGTLSDQYNIKSFAIACQKIKQDGGNFQIRFVGSIAENKLSELIDHGLKDNIEIINYVPHKESVEYLLNSSALFLVIPDTVGNEAILTGKLFEYLGARKPIIGLGPINGDAAKLIKETQSGQFFDYQESELLYNYLKELIGSKESINTIKSLEIEKYSRKMLTKKLSELI